MVVSSNTYGYYETLEGTLAEVVGALQSDGVKKGNLIALGYDVSNSKWAAIYWKA